MSGEREELRKQMRRIVIDSKNMRPEEIGKAMYAVLNPTKKVEEIVEVTCTHYERNCNIRAECCKRIFPCRLCHNENSDHMIDRYSTIEIQCRECKTLQKVSNECENCGITFGEYFCPKCRLWAEKKKTNIFHCDECGLCRIGSREDITHCDKCGFCLPNAVYEKHLCIEGSSQMTCSICNEKTFDSVKLIGLLECGHPYHIDCLKEFCRHDYRCPICRKSIGDMSGSWEEIDEEIRLQPMPSEYTNIKSDIFCNDCTQTSTIPHHFVGLKCPHCASYNTVIMRMDEMNK